MSAKRGSTVYNIWWIFYSIGESGLVYRGYVKVDQTHKLVAIKTGKGDYVAIKMFVA